MVSWALTLKVDSPRARTFMSGGLPQPQNRCLSSEPHDFGYVWGANAILMEVFHGVDICRYSIYQDQANEAEVLLFPGTKWLVVEIRQIWKPAVPGASA